MNLKDKVFFIESPVDIYKYTAETIRKIIELAKHNKETTFSYVTKMCVYCRWNNITIEKYIDSIYEEQINKTKHTTK